MAVTVTITGLDRSGASVKAVQAKFAQLARNINKQQNMMGKGAAKASKMFETSWSKAISRVAKRMSLLGGLGGIFGAAGFGAMISGAAKADVAVKGLANRLRLSIKEVTGIGVGLVKASSGTISFRRAIQLANKALKFLPVEQMKTTMEFISKRALIAGENIEVALDRVITGLARGSTLLLDDFGILVDGVKGVREEFDKLRGKGAFEALSGSDQKRELVRQAMKEMAEDSRIIADLSGTIGATFAKLGPSIKNILDRSGILLLEGPLKFIRPLLEGIAKIGEIVPLLTPKQMRKLAGILWSIIWETGKGFITDLVIFIGNQLKGMFLGLIKFLLIQVTKIAEKIVEIFAPFDVVKRLGGFTGRVIQMVGEAVNDELKKTPRGFDLFGTQQALSKNIPEFSKFAKEIGQTGLADELKGLSKLGIRRAIQDGIESVNSAIKRVKNFSDRIDESNKKGFKLTKAQEEELKVRAKMLGRRALGAIGFTGGAPVTAIERLRAAEFSFAARAREERRRRVTGPEDRLRRNALVEELMRLSRITRTGLRAEETDIVGRGERARSIIRSRRVGPEQLSEAQIKESLERGRQIVMQINQEREQRKLIEKQTKAGAETLQAQAKLTEIVENTKKILAGTP